MASLARSVAWGPICGIEFNGVISPFLCARAQERAATRQLRAQKRAATRRRRPSCKGTAFGNMRKTIVSSALPALFFTFVLLVLSALLMCMVVRKLVNSGRTEWAWRDHDIVLITGECVKGVKGNKGWQVQLSHVRVCTLWMEIALDWPPAHTTHALTDQIRFHPSTAATLVFHPAFVHFLTDLVQIMYAGDHDDTQEGLRV